MAIITEWRPSQAIDSGLPDDVTGTITEAVFVLHHFGVGGNEFSALRLTVTPDDGGTPIVDYFSAGSPESLRPTEDGHDLETGPGYTGNTIRKSTNLKRLLDGLVADAKVNALDLTGVSLTDYMLGLQVHMKRKPKLPEEHYTDKNGVDRVREMLMIDAVHGRVDVTPRAAGQPVAATPAAPKTAAPKTTTKKAASLTPDEINEASIAVALAILASNPDGVAASRMPMQAVQIFNGSANVDKLEIEDTTKDVLGDLPRLEKSMREIGVTIAAQDWLEAGATSGLWEYRGGKVYPNTAAVVETA